MPKRSWPGWRSSQRTLPFQSAAGTTPPFERKPPRKRFFEVRPSKSVPRLVGIGGKCTPKVKLQLGTISPSVSMRYTVLLLRVRAQRASLTSCGLNQVRAMAWARVHPRTQWSRGVVYCSRSMSSSRSLSWAIARLSKYDGAPGALSCPR